MLVLARKNRERVKMGKKEDDKSMVNAGLAAVAEDVVSRYGGGVKEHIVAYSGIDNEIPEGQAGHELKRSLKSIAKSKVNPDYEKQNYKQQAGFSAEVEETARRRAEERIAGKKPTTSRTDDLGHPNHELFDISSEVDSSGNPVPGSSAQMKFVGSTPEVAVDKMLGKDYQKYIDNDCKMLVPSDYYDGMKAALSHKMDSLEKQIEHLKAKGNYDAAAKKQAQLDKCRKLFKNLRKSNVSNAEAMEARKHPKWSTAKDIAKVAHRAGVEQAKMGAVIGGGVSIIRNMVAVCKGEKDAREALADVGCDTASAASVSYITGAAGSALKGAMQNAKTGALRAISKTNLPGFIVTSTLEVGKSLKRYFAGEIDGAECLEELGEKGYGSISGAMFAVIGQVSIPIPVVGALAGSMIGYSLSSLSFKILKDSLNEAKLAHEQRIRIEAECAEAVKMIREYRAEMEATIARYFSERMAFFDDTFKKIQVAMGTGDVDDYIAGMNAIAIAHGATPQFSNMEEFKDFMASSQAFAL